MDIYGPESIILKIGDLKLSDTGETFGKEKSVNGFQYTPLKDPKNKTYSQIAFHLAHGDSREGVSIKNERAEVLLTFGANRSNSNAQNMAIGYYNGKEYFFIVECFRDIYSEHPTLSSRSIIRCQSLWERSEKDVDKAVFNWRELDFPEHIEQKEKLAEKESALLKELQSRIKVIEKGLTRDSLSNLRLMELFKKRRMAQHKDDEGR